MIKHLLLLTIFIFIAGCAQNAKTIDDLVAKDAQVQKLAGDFMFTEGPAADKEGNIYFTDQPNDRIMKWSVDGDLSVFHESPERSNGLYFDDNGNLLACADMYNKLVSINMQDKSLTKLADNWEGYPLNGPNDLWLDPKGGIYFTDPWYKRNYWERTEKDMDIHGVYYLKPDRVTLIRVADDFKNPNGIIGTPDGSTLYVSDRSGNKTWSYTINADGTLSGKTLFNEMGSDGMTIDNLGNVYLTDKAVSVYSRDGKLTGNIEVPESPSNVCFGGTDMKTLFITARTSLYAIKMQVHGVRY